MPKKSPGNTGIIGQIVRRLSPFGIRDMKMALFQHCNVLARSLKRLDRLLDEVTLTVIANLKAASSSLEYHSLKASFHNDSAT
jgi:hypothetical protein